MADVVVVGAGIAGMAAAARLAKLGHSVTVFERGSTAGGRVHSIERDGFRWDAGPSSTALPAVLRDLFRISGRPIERYLELDLRTPARRHLFADGTAVDLPTGSRADQIRAVDAGLDAGAGTSWAEFVDGQADVWHELRRSPIGPDAPDGASDGSRPRRSSLLPGRSSLDRLLHRTFSDERLRQMVGYRFVLSGSSTRRVPAYAAVAVYVERSFGLWTCPSGLSGLSDALLTRLTERAVEVRYESAVTQIACTDDGVIGVELATGEFFPADHVVAAVDPFTALSELVGRRGATAARAFSGAPRVEPPAVTHLGLRHENPDGLPEELVSHGDPLVVIQTGGRAPVGHRAWTVRRRRETTEDVLVVLAGRGLDLRREVAVRVDRSPSQIRSEIGGAAYDHGWDSPRAQRRRSRFANPLRGLHVVAATLTPDASIPQVAWAAAHVANRIGRA